MPSQQFIRDRRRGNVGVKIVAERLEKRGLKVRIVPDGFFQGWDIEIYNKNGTISPCEVKTDYRWEETGNVAIEEDALRHTKTQAWFYVLYSKTPQVHLIDYDKACLNAKYAVRKGHYGEHGELVSLIPLPLFNSQISLKQI